MISATAIGHLARDPDTRYTSGNSVTNFAIAVNQKFGQNETTTWINCSFWGKRGETFGSYHNKGDKAAVSGTLYADKYTGKDGTERESWKMDVSNFTFVRDGNNKGNQPDRPLPRTGPSTQQVNGYSGPSNPDIPF